MSCPTVIRVTTGTGPPGIGLPAGTADAGKYVRKAGSTAYAYELVTPDQVGLPQGLSSTSSPTFAGLTLGGMSSAVGSLVLVGANGQLTTVLLGTNLSLVDGALVVAGGSSGGGGYPLYAITNTYTASGAISPTDRVAVINSASAVTMTLAAGPSDGHSMVIKRFGAGAVTVTAVFDGANFSIVADSATIRESVQLTWAPSLATWLILG
jgi:hypothetical protein